MASRQSPGRPWEPKLMSTTPYPAQPPLTIPLLSRNSALEKRGESGVGGPGNPEDD